MSDDDQNSGVAFVRKRMLARLGIDTTPSEGNDPIKEIRARSEARRRSHHPDKKPVSQR